MASSIPDLTYIKFEIDCEPSCDKYTYAMNSYQMKLIIHTEYKNQPFTLGQSILTNGHCHGKYKFRLTLVECQTNQNRTDSSQDLSTGLLNDSTEISLVLATGSKLKFGLKINDVIIPYPEF